MTIRPVRIHPLALEEAEAAANWYFKHSPRAAESFLNEIDQLVARIAAHPEQFGDFEFDTRRAMFRRFPFLMIFRDTTEHLEIIAVAHARRRPGYWHDRV